MIFSQLTMYLKCGQFCQKGKSVIWKIEHNATADRYLYNILLEEVDYLFHNDRDVDDVADIIQNRASVYISESK